MGGFVTMNMIRIIVRFCSSRDTHIIFKGRLKISLVCRCENSSEKRHAACGRSIIETIISRRRSSSVAIMHHSCAIKHIISIRRCCIQSPFINWLIKITVCKHFTHTITRIIHRANIPCTNIFIESIINSSGETSRSVSYCMHCAIRRARDAVFDR